MNYSDAHDSSLSIEIIMRKNFLESAKNYEASLGLFSPVDLDSIKEIETLPDKIKLENVYKQFYKKIDNISVWIVDGNIVRRDIYPDFGFGGNFLEFYFIPENEIWIDAQISCEELIYTIELEKLEISEMRKGKSYDNAYEFARSEILKYRDSTFLQKIKY